MTSNHEHAPQIDQRDVIKAYIERERELWLPAHQQAERAGRMNATLNATADEHLRRIDEYLEELHALGNVALSQVLDQSS